MRTMEEWQRLFLEEMARIRERARQAQEDDRTAVRAPAAVFTKNTSCVGLAECTGLGRNCWPS